MKKLLSIILTVFLFQPVYANCSKDVQHLDQSSPAPCEGYLFSPQKELEVRIKVGTYDDLQKMIDSEKVLTDTLQQRLDNMQKYNATLIEQNNQQRTQDFWEKTAYFALGVIITGVIATNVR